MKSVLRRQMIPAIWKCSPKIFEIDFTGLVTILTSRGLRSCATQAIAASNTTAFLLITAECSKDL